MATFFNQATLSYGNIIKNSNVTEGEIISGAGLTKTAFTTDYGVGDSISYAITLTNNSASDVSGATVTDDLGTFTPVGGTIPLTPLTYVDNSLLYFVNGVPATAPTAQQTAGELIISGIAIPAGGTVTLIYETRANEFAPLGENASITNTATTGGAYETLTASATVETRDTLELSIAKAVCPAVVVNNGEITYTFIVQNYGNIPATATDNVIISDTFNPALTDIAVTLNGATLTEGVDYTYDEATGEFTTTVGTLTVPAATFVRNPETGVVTSTPGVATVTVTGTI